MVGAAVVDAAEGRITTEDMRAMNEAVDGERRDPAGLLWTFWVRKGL
jgi:glycine betaine/choline ABC-type transport system substrate-binding protein